MPRRQLFLSALTAIAMSILSACADAGSPTGPSSLEPTANASLQVGTGSCRGGWNSSTGRCK